MERLTEREKLTEMARLKDEYTGGIEIKGLYFYKTCDSCPEQYTVFDNKANSVGYIRLRWGYLTCRYPDVGGNIIYDATLDEGGWKGCFEDEEERMLYLNIIADKILEKINN